MDEVRRWEGNHILQDVAIIVLSILIAVILVRTGVLKGFLTSLGALGAWSAFFAGIFFTSVFTTAPAIAALGEIALAYPLLSTALLGGLGAVIGDLIIFKFVRDRFSEDIGEMLAHEHVGRRFRLLYHRRFFRYFTFLLGGVVLASPLPDELGIALLGFSRMQVKTFALLSFIFNSLGILAIGLIARAVAA